MAIIFHSIVWLSLAAGISAYSNPSSDITVTKTNTRTVYTCPCDSTTYFAQTSPAIPQSSAWLQWYGSSSNSVKTTKGSAFTSIYQSSATISTTRVNGGTSGSSSVTSKTSQSSSISISGQISSISSKSSAASSTINASVTSASGATSSQSQTTTSIQSGGSSSAMNSQSTTSTMITTVSSLSSSTTFVGSPSSTSDSTTSGQLISTSSISSTSISIGSASTTSLTKLTTSDLSTSTASTASSSSSSPTTTSSSAPSLTPFSIKISIQGPVGKRSDSSIGFSNGNAVIVTDASSAYAFAITPEGSLIVYGTTTTVGVLRDDGVRTLQQVLPADGTNAMLTGWTLDNGALTYPSVTFCISSANEVQAAFGIPLSSCNRATFTADSSSDSFNIGLSQSSSTTSTTMTSTATTTTTTMTTATPSSCVVDVAAADRPCTPGRIYQSNGAIFQEYCDATIIAAGGPPTNNFEARSYDACSALCAKNPNCDGFGASMTNPPPANSGPCMMFLGTRFIASTPPGSGVRGGKKLSAAPCGSDSTYVTTTSTSATSTGPVQVAAPTATSCTARYPYPEDNCNTGTLYYYSNVTPQLYSVTACQVNITGTAFQQTTVSGWDSCAKACMTVDACQAYVYTQFNPNLLFGNGYCNMFDTTSNFVGSAVPGYAGVKLKTLPAGCS